MYTRGCKRARRAGLSRGRRAWPVLVTLGAATMACSTAMGQGQPNVVGEWNIPKGEHGYDWDQVVLAEHAAHLFTGKILVWEDDNDPAPQLWNPDDGSFTPVELSFGHIIDCGGHAALADGSILVAGGGGETGNPASNKTSLFGFSFGFSPWKPVAPMSYPRWYPTCTTLADGTVLVMAGADEPGPPGCAVTTPEIYDPVADTWTALPTELTLEISRWYPFMFVVPDGNKVFFAGGSGGDGCGVCTLGCDSFILDLDVNPETWDWVADNPMAWGGSSAVMYEPGLVLKCGGKVGGVRDTFVIDMTMPFPIWQAEVFMTHPRRRHNLVLLPDGTILAIGGRNSQGAVFEPELFDPDPLGPGWTTMATAGYPHARHSTAVLLADGKVLAAGGVDFAPNDGKAEVFSPRYLFDANGEAPRPEIGFAPTAVSYGNIFKVILSGGSPVGAAEIDKVSFVRLAAVTHGFDQNQRYVPLGFEVHARACPLKM